MMEPRVAPSLIYTIDARIVSLCKRDCVLICSWQPEDAASKKREDGEGSCPLGLRCSKLS